MSVLKKLDMYKIKKHMLILIILCICVVYILIHMKLWLNVLLCALPCLALFIYSLKQHYVLLKIDPRKQTETK